jgi:hypothetical protein
MIIFDYDGTTLRLTVIVVVFSPEKKKQLDCVVAACFLFYNLRL